MASLFPRLAVCAWTALVPAATAADDAPRPVDDALARFSRLLETWNTSVRHTSYTPWSSATLARVRRVLPTALEQATGVRLIDVTAYRTHLEHGEPTRHLGLTSRTEELLRDGGVSWLPWAWPTRLRNGQEACVYQLPSPLPARMGGLPPASLEGVVMAHELLGHAVGRLSRSVAVTGQLPAWDARARMEGEADALGLYVYGRSSGDIKGVLRYALGRASRFDAKEGGWVGTTLRVAEHLLATPFAPLDLTDPAALREALATAQQLVDHEPATSLRDISHLAKLTRPLTTGHCQLDYGHAPLEPCSLDR